MIKFFFHIFIIIILSSCLNSDKPFSNDKNDSKIIKKDIFISNIIGLNKNQNNKIRIIIKDKLTNKNILSSYKFMNKNSHILSATIIKYSENHKIIWKLFNPTINMNSKYSFNIDKSNISENKNFILPSIAEDITNALQNSEYSDLNYIFVKIDKITGLKNEYKNIFLDNLINISNDFKIKYISDKEKHKYDFKLNIIIKFSEVSSNETELKFNWIIKDKNNKNFGNLEQQKVINNNLIKNIWPQLSNKIIEMALIDINYLINLEK